VKILFGEGKIENIVQNDEMLFIIGEIGFFVVEI